jgi:hypothetical protein
VTTRAMSRRRRSRTCSPLAARGRGAGPRGPRLGGEGVRIGFQPARVAGGHPRSAISRSNHPSRHSGHQRRACGHRRSAARATPASSSRDRHMERPPSDTPPAGSARNALHAQVQSRDSVGSGGSMEIVARNDDTQLGYTRSGAEWPLRWVGMAVWPFPSIHDADARQKPWQQQ